MHQTGRLSNPDHNKELIPPDAKYSKQHCPSFIIPDSTITILPSELLCRIFRTLKSFPSRHSDKSIPILVNLLHVCRTWRLVAAGDPSLWTTIDFSNREWTKVFLQLSQDQPLDVHTDFSSRFWPEASYSARSILNHLCRVRTLIITADGKFALHKVLQEFGACHAPLLETLEFHSSLSSPPGTPKLMHNIFGGHTPSLRRLCISDGTFEPTLACSIFRGLTHLEVTNATGWSAFTSTGDLLSVLEMSPRLEGLSLEFVKLGAFDTAEDQSIHLPCLRELTLRASLPSVSCLLGCLDSPPLLSVRLTVIMAMDDWNYQVHLTRIASFVSLHPGTAIQSLYIHEDPPCKRLLIRGWTAPSPAAVMGSMPKEAFLFAVESASGSLADDALIHILGSAIPALPLADARCLTANVFGRLSTNSCALLCRAMPRLQELRVEGRHSMSFLEALALPYVHEGQLWVPLPHLETVYMCEGLIDHCWFVWLLAALQRRQACPKLQEVCVWCVRYEGVLEPMVREGLKRGAHLVTVSTPDRSYEIR